MLIKREIEFILNQFVKEQWQVANYKMSRGFAK